MLLGGSIIVSDAAPIRAVLAEVYPALGMVVDPDTVAGAVDVGCVTDDPDEVAEALLAPLQPAVAMSFRSLPDSVRTPADR